MIGEPFSYTTMGAIAFGPNVNLTGFSGVYTAKFIPEESGLYAFKIAAQGPTALYINGKKIRESDNISSSEPFYVLEAKKGKKYDIKLTFAQKHSETSLSFDLGRIVPVDVKGIVDKVKDADVVIFAGGISPRLEGEEMPVKIDGFKGGDRTDIELPKIQRMMVEALANAGKKVVFVNFSGSAMGLVPEDARCAAVLQAWYPGQAGGQAIADVLLGEYNPSGRLPLTFYRNINQIPDYEDYSMKGRTYRYFNGDPLYRFGHGLSYTDFSYGKADIRKNADGALISVPVSNTGDREGDEVVQVYLRKVGDAEGPIMALRGFKRISVKPGETLNAVIEIPLKNFEWYDPASESMKVLPGEYELLIGGSSDINKLHKYSIVL